MSKEKKEKLPIGESDEKEQRQNRIVDIIRSEDIRKQSELCIRLKKEGFKNHSQSTVNRDLEELRIPKDPETGFYTSSEETKNRQSMARLGRAVSENVLSVHTEVSFFAMRTSVGHARSTAVILEQAFKGDVVGTVSEDDTILVICEDSKIASDVVKKVIAMQKKSQPSQ